MKLSSLKDTFIILITVYIFLILTILSCSFLNCVGIMQAGTFPPLKQQIFRSQLPVITGTELKGRPDKYKLWYKDNLELAYQSYLRKEFL